MSANQCDYCMYLDEDAETGEMYCTIQMDQDDYARLQLEPRSSCPYFRMGDDYTIVKKQGT